MGHARKRGRLHSTFLQAQGFQAGLRQRLKVGFHFVKRQLRHTGLHQRRKLSCAAGKAQLFDLWQTGQEIQRLQHIQAQTFQPVQSQQRVIR